MKVLLVNTYDVGGAAKAFLRLYCGLQNMGLNTKTLIRFASDNLNKEHQEVISESYVSRLCNKFFYILRKFELFKNDQSATQSLFLKRRPEGLEYFSFPNSNFDITQTKEYQEADIIHLHWVADFLDWDSFFLKNNKPLVWTLHDQNPFLGGEHYAEKFLGIDELGCPIPRIYTQDELVTDSRIFEVKRLALKDVTQIHIVCPSQWMLNISKHSELFRSFNHYLIPNGFPVNIFRPYDKLVCRQILGLNPMKLVILFVAESLNNHRKGFDYLQRSLVQIDNDLKFKFEYEFCAAGGEDVNNTTKNIKYLGKIIDERMMALVYNAADVFIIPSLEDNLPNTMIESLLCGTPVIGFPTGGIIETIENGFNGLVCKDVSVGALTSEIEFFISGLTLFNREEIALAASRKYNVENQSQSYMNLYKSILSYADSKA